MLDADGNEIHRTEERTYSAGRLDSDDIEIFRDDLCESLMNALSTNVEFLYSDSIRAIDQSKDGVRVEFESGSHRSFDILIGADVTERFFLEMCRAGVLVNVVMFVFNLFPLPPLDGGRILVGLLPWKQASMLSRVEPWGFFIVLALILTHVLDWLWLLPGMSLTYGVLDLLLRPFALLVG